MAIKKRKRLYLIDGTVHVAAWCLADAIQEWRAFLRESGRIAQIERIEPATITVLGEIVGAGE